MLSLFLLLGAVALWSQSGKYFEGVVHFYQEKGNFPDEVLEELQSEGLEGDKLKQGAVWYIQPPKRAIVTYGMGYSSLVVDDYTSRTSIECLLDRKKCCREPFGPEGYHQEKVERLTEKTEILGYSCQKAVVTNKSGVKMNCYYTTELPSLKYGSFRLLNGFPLYIEMPEWDGSLFVMMATEVKPMALSQDIFQLPEGIEFIDCRSLRAFD